MARSIAMSKYSIKILFASAICASIGAMVACGDDDDDATPSVLNSEAGADAASEASDTPGSVAGTATYNGAKKGPLYLTVYPSFPPQGMPSGIGAVNSPTWPGSNNYTITNVDPGKYVVLSYISVGTDHNMGPQPGDPVSQPVPVTIEAGKQAKADLVLADIPDDAGAGDASSDGGDGGDGG